MYVFAFSKALRFHLVFVVKQKRALIEKVIKSKGNALPKR